MSLSNKNYYLQQLEILVKASVPIILTSIKEPNRLTTSLTEYCQVNNTNLNFWTADKGWETVIFSKSETEENSYKIIPDTASPIAALKALFFTEDCNPQSFINDVNNFFVIQWFQPYFGNPLVTQLLYKFSQYAIYNGKRLILLIPDLEKVPKEIKPYIHILPFKLPNYVELQDSMLSIFSDININISQYNSNEFKPIIEAGKGLTLFEFESAIAQYCVNSKTKDNLSIDCCSKFLQKIKTNTINQSEVLESIPTSSINDIGGLEHLKNWIKSRKICFNQDALKFGVDRPKGIGLFGSPGTGKSLTAKVIASELNIPLIKFNLPQVFSSLVGSSEARIKSALETINAIAPCVCFIDEIDKAFDVSSSGDSGVSKRVLSSILSDMQENESGVFWVFTANRVTNLPSELLRKGRLDELWALTTPNEREREDIIKIHVNKRNSKFLENSYPLATKASKGFVGAEIESVIKEAFILAYLDKSKVTDNLIAQQFNLVTPLSVSFVEQFTSMEEWAKTHARNASLNDQDKIIGTGGIPRIRNRKISIGNNS